MKTQRKISFNYRPSEVQKVNNQPIVSSFHLISSHRILKFNYQVPFQPTHQRLKTFQSASFDNAYHSIVKPNPPQYNIHTRESSRGTQKIKLSITSRKKDNNKVKDLPQLLEEVIDSQRYEQSQKAVEQIQLNQKVQDKVANDVNPQLKYLYSVPNHISQENCQINCDLFSTCRQPIQNQQQNDKGKPQYLDIARQFTNSQVIQAKDQHPFRRKIFQTDYFFNASPQKQRRISQFSSKQYECQEFKPQADLAEKPVNRRRLFSEAPRVFKASQACQGQDDNELIPKNVKDFWLKKNMNIVKWLMESPTLHASPELNNEERQQH